MRKKDGKAQSGCHENDIRTADSRPFIQHKRLMFHLPYCHRIARQVCSTAKVVRGIGDQFLCRAASGIEICVDAGGDFEQAKVNAASLVRLLMERHDIPLDRVVQHNRWNGKDCPKTIRATASAWEAFLALCGGQGSQDTDPELEAAVDALAAAGIIDSPERWKALDYTANTVRLLLLKMGRYVTN